MPTALACDPGGKTTLPVGGANELLHVDELGLELDHEQASGGACHARMSMTPRSPYTAKETSGATDQSGSPSKNRLTDSCIAE